MMCSDSFCGFQDDATGKHGETIQSRLEYKSFNSNVGALFL